MRILARYAVGGGTAGFWATALTLLAFPQFYTRPHELLVFPLAACAVGVAVGVVVLAAGAVLRRSRPKGGPLIGRAFLASLAAGVVISLVMYAVRSPARSWKVAPEMIVMCIDGGTWNVIDPLAAAGRLPNLDRLRREGTSAVLQSTDPSFSLVVWTTIGTGVQPEEHGVTSFYHTQDYLQAKRIWEVFEDNGHSVGLFRWWITWPPRVRNGFVIPDILARDAECFPPNYNFVNQFRQDQKSDRSVSAVRTAATAWRFLRAGLRLETCLEIAGELLPAVRSGRYADYHIAARRAEIRLNADVYCHMLREFGPEYTCFYDNGADAMSHFYWQYYEPDRFGDVDPQGVARYGRVIPDYYVLHDRVIGRILDHVDPSASVVVLSDHGFTADVAGKEMWVFAKGGDILGDLGLEHDYYSIALASQTFVQSVRQDPAENRAALERVVGVLDSLTEVESGIRLFDATMTGEARVLLGVSPRIRSLEGHVETPRGTVKLDEWFTTRTYSGTHHPEGIVIVKGPAYRSGHAGETAQLTDIAPTLLYTAGFPLSRELDGGVMWDWITDEFSSGHGVELVDTYGRYDPERRDVEVDEETLKKLRALGYVR